MRNLTASAFFVCTSLFAFAQHAETSTDYKAQVEDVNTKKIEKGKNYNVNYQIANQEAYFEAGEDSLFRYLISKINMPPAAVSANLNGNSMIGFQVNFDGKVSNAYTIAKVGYGIDEQLMQELQKLNFKPATQGSIPYRSEVVLEIPIKAAYIKD
ncbi:MAG: energy transducer TonB [Bacteroidia bacterium]|jgi:hypothetical protein